jgi:hypothetical protein
MEVALHCSSGNQSQAQKHLPAVLTDALCHSLVILTIMRYSQNCIFAQVQFQAFL